MSDLQGRTLAIIKRPIFGVNDRGLVGLTFQAYIRECVAAQQFIGVDDIGAFLRDMDCSDVNRLEGKPCWVIEEGNMIKFAGAWKQ